MLLKGAVSLGSGSYTLGAPQNLSLDSQVRGKGRVPAAPDLGPPGAR